MVELILPAALCLCVVCLSVCCLYMSKWLQVVFLVYQLQPGTTTVHYVKAFNLAALKVGDFLYKIILAPFTLANLNYNSNTTYYNN